MPPKGKLARSLSLMVVGLLCVIAGFGVGRLPAFSHPAKAVPVAYHASHGNIQVQGIKIHGWWTITVLDHGRLVRTSSFENSLLTVNQVGNGGDVVLAGLLTRLYTMGPWVVYIADAGGHNLFTLSSGSDWQALHADGQLAVSGNSSPGHAILSGQYTNPAASPTINIGKVSTSVSLCTTATSADNCTTYFNNFFFNFTTQLLAQQSQVSVAPGQIVQVKVDISFS